MPRVDEAYVGPELAPVGGRCYPDKESSAKGREHVAYPFRSPLTGASFDRAVLSWSGRNEPYDTSFDGVAHVGMVPDFVEELRVMGLGDGSAARAPLVAVLEDGLGPQNLEPTLTTSRDTLTELELLGCDYTRD